MRENRFNHQRADVGRLRKLVERDVELAWLRQDLAEQLPNRLGRGGVAVGEIFEHDPIVGAGQEFADGGLAVAARAACFLRVVLQGLRQVVVIDAADVRLVDPHAKSDRGDDRMHAAIHEGILCCMPLFVRQAGVVSEGLDPALPQIIRHVLRCLLERHVDDRRSLPFLQSAREQPETIFVGAGGDAVGEVWSQERGLHMVGLVDPKGPADIGRDGRRGRGRECQNGADAEFLGHMRQSQIFRPEVVPPLRDAVGLVHRHHRDPGPRKPRDELFIRQPLRGDVEQFQRAAADTVIDARRLGRRERGIEPRRRDAPRLERLDLILHQGDQRRDDDRQPVHQEAGQLVAERLAGARGKERKRASAGQQ